MMSQETIDFVEDIVKTILSRWESLPVHLRDKMRDELMSVFISFVGAGENKTLKDRQVNRIIFMLTLNVYNNLTFVLCS